MLRFIDVNGRGSMFLYIHVRIYVLLTVIVLLHGARSKHMRYDMCTSTYTIVDVEVSRMYADVGVNGLPPIVEWSRGVRGAAFKRDYEASKSRT